MNDTKNAWKRFLPILVIFSLVLVVYFLRIDRSINFQTLRYHHVEMTEFVNDHPFSTPFIFIALYAAATMLSIPSAAFLSLLGGFLFKAPLAILYVTLGATGGASMLFLAGKAAFKDLIGEKAGPRLTKMKEGFEKNPANYLLFLRLVPLFPFWLGNIAPSFFNVTVFTFIWTTFLGVIPLTCVYTQAGRGLGVIFETQDSLNLSSFLNPEMTIALTVLALLTLMPLLVRKMRDRKRLD